MTSGGTSRTAAILAVAAGAAIIGLAPVGVRLAHLGPQATAFWRFVFALPTLAAAAALLRPARPGGGDVRLLLLAGIFFGLDIALWQAALSYTTIANATLYSNMTPVVAAVAGTVLFKERLGLAWVTGASLAVAGAAAMSLGRAQAHVGHLSGDLLGLASMVWYAAYLVAMRIARTRVTAVAAMLVTTFAAMLTVALSARVMGEALLPAPGDWKTWGVVIGLGVFVHSGGQGLIAYGVGKLPIALSTVLLFVQPVAAALFGWLLFHEPLGPLGLLGAAAILVGVFIVQGGRR